jgi:hypothetical protein
MKNILNVGKPKKIDDFIIFNKAVKSFLIDLNATYVNVAELEFIQSVFKMVKKLSKKLPHKIFNMTIKNFKDRIIERDSDYFNSDEFKISYMVTLKKMWKDVDSVNKKHIFDHLNLLIKLSDNCYNKDKDVSSEGDISEEETN